ncbi:homeobox protein meis2 [Anaeramoeba flamelloides]|uniref:Homeobox protein meis2 n=1 Tax=Anaeramoeba flamelloides TaxID=1746091 RepID=A0ABQ8ZC90_9EUKA|nr:homeobox protein meis2 [Anaeramoeba flamelloides]
MSFNSLNSLPNIPIEEPFDLNLNFSFLDDVELCKVFNGTTNSETWNERVSLFQSNTYLDHDCELKSNEPNFSNGPLNEIKPAFQKTNQKRVPTDSKKQKLNESQGIHNQTQKKTQNVLCKNKKRMIKKKKKRKGKRKRKVKKIKVKINKVNFLKKDPKLFLALREITRDLNNFFIIEKKKGICKPKEDQPRDLSKEILEKFDQDLFSFECLIEENENENKKKFQKNFLVGESKPTADGESKILNLRKQNEKKLIKGNGDCISGDISIESENESYQGVKMNLDKFNLKRNETKNQNNVNKQERECKSKIELKIIQGVDEKCGKENKNNKPIKKVGEIFIENNNIESEKKKERKKEKEKEKENNNNNIEPEQKKEKEKEKEKETQNSDHENYNLNEREKKKCKEKKLKKNQNKKELLNGDGGIREMETEMEMEIENEKLDRYLELQKKSLVENFKQQKSKLIYIYNIMQHGITNKKYILDKSSFFPHIKKTTDQRLLNLSEKLFEKYIRKLQELKSQQRKSIQKKKDRLLLENLKTNPQDENIRKRNFTKFSKGKIKKIRRNNSGGSNSNDGNENTNNKFRYILFVTKKKRRNKRKCIPENAKKILEKWYLKHVDSENGPFMNYEERLKFVQETQLSEVQISRWVGQKRRFDKENYLAGKIEKPKWL